MIGGVPVTVVVSYATVMNDEFVSTSEGTVGAEGGAASVLRKAIADVDIPNVVEAKLAT